MKIERESRGREDRWRGKAEGGFTLLEVTLTLMLIVILMGGIYSIAAGAIQLGSEVSETQNREMLVHSFLQLCRRNIEALPGNAGMTLLAEETGRFYVTEVAFVDAPLAFAFAAVPAGYNKTILMSEADSRGFLNVSLRYLNVDEEDAFTGSSDQEEGIRLPLLEGVNVFEWRFYDVETDEWQVIWEDEEKRPSFVELNLGFVEDVDPIRAVFWVPPVADPETVILGAATVGGGTGPGSGAAPGAGGSGNPAAPGNPGSPPPGASPPIPGQGARGGGGRR
ncbi:MAG: hypothetical protein ACC661_12665 [Verrucomicrobiales bacterium]